MSEIEWAEPPIQVQGGNRGVGRWFHVADELRQRPGIWAKIATNTWSSIGAQLTHGAMPKDQFEVTTRSAGLGYAKDHCDVYARYIGDQS